MAPLLRLPRVWWFATVVTLAVATAGVAISISRHGKPEVNVLGEKVTGSGTSNSSGIAAGGSKSPNNNAGSNSAPGHSFTISGTIDGLFPGSDSRLFLTVTNPNNQDLTITSLSASLQSVTGAPGCNAASSNLAISPYTGPSFDVTKNSSMRSAGYIPLTLPNSTANACQGATYNLAYSGTAVQK